MSLNKGTPRDAIDELSRIVRDHTGVQLNDRHREMVKSRLTKRVNDLNLESLDHYLQYFLGNQEVEMPHLIGLLTTHHTYFFREYAHFEFLAQKGLSALVAEAKTRADKKIRVWCAACSRGQEVYSLAMFLDFHIKKIDPTVGFEILGTDIDPGSVEFAKNGVYLYEEIKEIPLSMLGGHWSRGKGDIASYAKVKESLRSHCRFQVGNVLEKNSKLPVTGKFDIIFCRNVFIYFNSDQIKSASEAILDRLTPTGFLFIGISESISQYKLPIQNRGPSIYQHKTQTQSVPLQSDRIQNQKADVLTMPDRLKVLCVDDSPSILTLLKKILSSEHGYEIVGTAVNGIEAAKKVQELKPDVMTLDIHMPEMTGLEYLERHFRSGHPPVVMVTSVSRENADLAGKALDSGASDYVEKPAMSNLEERGDEIRTKLRCAYHAHLSARASGSKRTLDLDRSFQQSKKVQDPHEKLRIITLNLSSRSKLKALFNDMKESKKVPCVIYVEGVSDALANLAGVLTKECQRVIQYMDQLPTSLSEGSCTLIGSQEQLKTLADRYNGSNRISFMVLGEASRNLSQCIGSYRSSAQIIIEDLSGGKGTRHLMAYAHDVVLPTSFVYLSDEYFSKSKEKKAA